MMYKVVALLVLCSVVSIVAEDKQLSSKQTVELEGIMLPVAQSGLFEGVTACGCNVCPCGAASPADPVVVPTEATGCQEAECERQKLAARARAQETLNEELVKYQAQLDAVDTTLRDLSAQFYLVENRHQLLLANLAINKSKLPKPDSEATIKALQEQLQKAKPQESSSVSLSESIPELPADFAARIPANVLYQQRMKKLNEEKAKKAKGEHSESSAF